MRGGVLLGVLWGGTFLAACSGNPVDLGQRGSATGFVDAPRSGALANPTTTQTLYTSDSGAIYGFAIDDTSLYALLKTGDDCELVSCPMDRCGSELSVLATGLARPDVGPPATAIQIVGDWLFWGYGANSPLDGVAACPKTGCRSPTKVQSTTRGLLATDDDYLYWTDYDGWLNRWNAEASVERLRYLAIDSGSELHGLAVAGDFVYFADAAATAILRARKDGSEPPELLLTSDAVSSIGATPDTIYYSSAILAGAISSCAATGCNGSDRTLVMNQRWPQGLRIAGADAFWLTGGATTAPDNLGIVSLWNCGLPECAGVRSFVMDFEVGDLARYNGDIDAVKRFAVNHEFVVWLERTQEVRQALRRRAR
ncbi:MAG TPA: hypothetical protein VHB79_08795 [Polyangiaceae bacterium]|nr:hypothetical protein [Polyangiaceae bacterium]